MGQPQKALSTVRLSAIHDQLSKIRYNCGDKLRRPSMSADNQRTAIPGSDRVNWASAHYPGQRIGTPAGRHEVEFTKRRLDRGPSGYVLQPLFPGVQILFPERDVMLAHRGADLPGPFHRSLYGACYPLPQVWFYLFRPGEHGFQESHS